MPKAPTQSAPKKFEMLKAMKQPATTKFVMGKASKPTGNRKFEMLGNKAAGPRTGFLQTMEMKTCL